MPRWSSGWRRSPRPCARSRTCWRASPSCRSSCAARSAAFRSARRPPRSSFREILEESSQRQAACARGAAGRDQSAGRAARSRVRSRGSDGPLPHRRGASRPVGRGQCPQPHRARRRGTRRAGQARRAPAGGRPRCGGHAPAQHRGPPRAPGRRHRPRPHRACRRVAQRVPAAGPHHRAHPSAGSAVRAGRSARRRARADRPWQPSPPSPRGAPTTPGRAMSMRSPRS